MKTRHPLLHSILESHTLVNSHKDSSLQLSLNPFPSRVLCCLNFYTALKIRSFVLLFVFSEKVRVLVFLADLPHTITAAPWITTRGHRMNPGDLKKRGLLVFGSFCPPRSINCPRRGPITHGGKDGSTGWHVWGKSRKSETWALSLSSPTLPAGASPHGNHKGLTR